MKDGLDRTGKKNRLKNGKNCMHWNVPPDALPGSKLAQQLGTLPGNQTCTARVALMTSTIILTFKETFVLSRLA